MIRPVVFGLAALVAPAPTAMDLTPRVKELLGIPYLEDAGLDERGRWTRFSLPEQELDRPALNCSGFVVAAARSLLGYQGSLAEAGRDRLGDSGPEATSGQDWDFGWDLLLNLSQGRPRRWVLPEGDRLAPGGDGRSLQGFRVQDREAWAKLTPRWRPDRVYLATLVRGRGGRIQHHHVALLLQDGSGALWFYQTLPKGRVHRLNLKIPDGFDRLCTMFGPGERVLILEVEP